MLLMLSLLVIGMSLGVVFSQSVWLGLVFVGIAIGARVLWHLCCESHTSVADRQHQRLLTLGLMLSAPVVVMIFLHGAVFYLPKPNYIVFHMLLLLYTSAFFWSDPEKVEY